MGPKMTDVRYIYKQTDRGHVERLRWGLAHACLNNRAGHNPKRLTDIICGLYKLYYMTFSGTMESVALAITTWQLGF